MRKPCGKSGKSGPRPVAGGELRRRAKRARGFSHRSSPATRHSLGGYTLLELLLVVAILVIVASAVAPTVVARMSEYRLKQAAETARFALSATRIRAIDGSSIYQFRFEPGGRRYLAVPTDGDALSATSQTRSVVENGQLPENLAFQVVAAAASSPLTAGTTAASTDGAWSAAVARVPNAANFTSAVWSPPIIFRPDGTAVDAALNVVDQHGEGFQLTVRELTGEIFVTRLSTGTL